MISTPRWRSRFLTTTTVGIALAVIYSAIAPSAGKRKVADFIFPQRITLNSWQQTSSQSLSLTQTSPDSDGEVVKSGKIYRYSQDDKNLTVEMRYIVGARGEIKSYLENHTSISPQVFSSAKMKHIPGIGYHILLTHQNQAYLSSCISPRAASSVTHQQFSTHRYRADWQFSVWLNWLWGKSSIRDRRCLWTNLSMAIDSIQSETTYQTLETVWIDWYRWWLPRFPNL